MERFSVSGGENGNIRPRGLASKNPAVSALQDLLFYIITGIAFYVKNLSVFQNSEKQISEKVTELLYLSNKGINFSVSAMIEAIQEAQVLKDKAESLYKVLCKTNNKKPKKSSPAAMIKAGESLSQLVSQANVINAQKMIKISNLESFAMNEIIRLSLCSTSNHLEHIKNFDNVPSEIYSMLFEILDFLGNNKSNLKEVSNFALKAGELQTQVLELTLKFYEKKYGLIERKKVLLGNKKGSAILVVGEDFSFLQKLLAETENKDINVYTYGALNYAHVFPKISKYKNLVGIYAGKYDNFASNIEDFPGVVVLTSGNIEEMTDIYRGRIFATEEISMLGVTKLKNRNIKLLINAAYDAPGFMLNSDNSYVELGFGAKEIERNVEKLYKLLKEKQIEKIIIFLGCNYFSDEKNYFKKLVKNLPQNSAVITMDCLLLNTKTDKTLPVILNLGQYLNFYVLVRLIFALSGKFKKNVNEMPLIMTIRLKDAETVASLLMLLSLGIKNIKINSILPNYLTEALLTCFGKSHNLSKISNAKDDAKNIKSNNA